MFIAPSKWLFNCARKSGLAGNKQVYHIPNLIDTSVYKPVDKSAARELFSLNGNTKVIGFGADSALTNPFKGWGYLKDALQILSQDETLQDKKIEILIFGSNYSKEIADNLPFPVHFTGYLQDDYSLIMTYNCMDVFVIPSIAENFPNTIIESLSCNTPVVGFNVGGIPDTVDINTGYLAEYKNSGDLARGISLILKEGKSNVREYVKSFNYREILNKHREMWNGETAN
jgi:glycosyltransferase involved in cell wall biosynthesis